MAALFLSNIDRGDWWSEELTSRMPDLEVRIWPEAGDLDDIDYLIVWKPPAGLLAKLPNLRAILSLGAGVDHLFADPSLPAGVPVCRVVDKALTERMCEYVLLAVMGYHRQAAAYRAQQQQGAWAELHQVSAAERSVGIMGLGVLGQAAARQLAATAGGPVVSVEKIRAVLLSILEAVESGYLSCRPADEVRAGARRLGIELRSPATPKGGCRVEVDD